MSLSSRPIFAALIMTALLVTAGAVGCQTDQTPEPSATDPGSTPTLPSTSPTPSVAGSTPSPSPTEPATPTPSAPPASTPTEPSATQINGATPEPTPSDPVGPNPTAAAKDVSDILEEANSRMEQVLASVREGQVLHFKQDQLDTQCCPGERGEPWWLPSHRTIEVWVATDEDLNIVRQEIMFADENGEVLQRSSVAQGTQVTVDMNTGEEVVETFDSETPFELPWVTEEGLLVHLDDENWEPQGTTTLNGSTASVYETETEVPGGFNGFVEFRQRIEISNENPHLSKLDMWGIDPNGTETIVSTKQVLALEALPTDSMPDPV